MSETEPMKRMRREEGFTLLELTLVTMMIGFLAIMAAPAFLQKHRSEAANRFAAELNWAMEAIRRFYVQNGEFPTNWAALIGVNAIPRIPLDPFGGNVVLTADNTVTPKTCTITVQNGIATTEYGGQITQRVPFSTHDLAAGTLTINMSEFMTHVTQDIAYGGIHADGDLVPVMPCFGGMVNYPFTAPAAFQNGDDTPIMAYRTWVETVPGGPTGTQYLVRCRTRGTITGTADDGSGTNCYVSLLQICH